MGEFMKDQVGTLARMPGIVAHFAPGENDRTPVMCLTKPVAFLFQDNLADDLVLGRHIGLGIYQNRLDILKTIIAQAEHQNASEPGNRYLDVVRERQSS